MMNIKEFWILWDIFITKLIVIKKFTKIFKQLSLTQLYTICEKNHWVLKHSILSCLVIRHHAMQDNFSYVLQRFLGTNYIAIVIPMFA